MPSLGQKSLNKLVGVKPTLVSVVRRAIEITTQDFAVTDGVRTLETQKLLVARGASKTLNSKHLTGDAVDLVPYVDGSVRWEWPLVFHVAEAVRSAALELGVDLTWGGVWDRSLLSYSDLRAEVEAYKARHPGPDFLDGPHFELRS